MRCCSVAFFLTMKGFQSYTAVLNVDFRIIFPGFRYQPQPPSSVTLGAGLNLPEPPSLYL